MYQGVKRNGQFENGFVQMILEKCKSKNQSLKKLINTSNFSLTSIFHYMNRLQIKTISESLSLNKHDIVNVNEKHSSLLPLNLNNSKKGQHQPTINNFYKGFFSGITSSRSMKISSNKAEVLMTRQNKRDLLRGTFQGLKTVQKTGKKRLKEME